MDNGLNELQEKYNIDLKIYRFWKERSHIRRMQTKSHLTTGDNERLEFLGDSVLGFITAEYLFRTTEIFPRAS